jgi:hypothetical protein
MRHLSRTAHWASQLIRARLDARRGASIVPECRTNPVFGGTLRDASVAQLGDNYQRSLRVFRPAETAGREQSTLVSTRTRAPR